MARAAPARGESHHPPLGNEHWLLRRFGRLFFLSFPPRARRDLTVRGQRYREEQRRFVGDHAPLHASGRQALTGLGDAGSRKGSEAIACVSNKIFTLDAKGTCTEWTASMFDKGKYKQQPAMCGFKQDGGKEIFAVTINGNERTLEVHGDALMSQPLAQSHSEKMADFATAKAARDAKKPR